MKKNLLIFFHSAPPNKFSYKLPALLSDLTSRVAQNELKLETVTLRFTSYCFHCAFPMSGCTLFLFKPTQRAISKGHKWSFYQMQTEIYNFFFRKTSQDSPVSFGFVANPSAVRQTRHGCSANQMAETI